MGPYHPIGNGILILLVLLFATTTRPQGTRRAGSQLQCMLCLHCFVSLCFTMKAESVDVKPVKSGGQRTPHSMPQTRFVLQSVMTWVLWLRMVLYFLKCLKKNRMCDIFRIWSARYRPFTIKPYTEKIC